VIQNQNQEMEKALSSEQRLLLKDVTEREKRLKSFKNDIVSHAIEISGLQEE
jgi:hypothetical protein